MRNVNLAFWEVYFYSFLLAFSLMSHDIKEMLLVSSSYLLWESSLILMMLMILLTYYFYYNNSVRLKW